MAKRRIPQHEPPEGENLMLPNEGGIPGSRSKFSKAPPAQTPGERNTGRRAMAKRKAWEETPEGIARTTDARTALGTGMTNAQIYAAKDWDKQTGIGPKHYDVQLPGMADPAAAPRPPKWEELSSETRAHAERALRGHGTSIEQMTSDFGAQTDQAYLRAEGHKAPLPYATDFYSSGEPRKVLDASAKKLGIPQPVHAVMNALTSPNTKFSQHRSSGETMYPNDEAASHVVSHVQMGGTHENLTNERTDIPGKRHQGYTTNMRKAARVYEQHEQGVTPDLWRGLPSKSNPEGKTIWGPKTGPYANSWSDTHPQFFVSDIHSGGGGMVPHLGTGKATGEVHEATGKPKMQKSEREGAIEKTPYFHSAADYAARQAMQQRGLGSIRDTQASQWGEEQLQRGETGQRGAPKASQVYPKRQDIFHKQVHGQEKLF